MQIRRLRFREGQSSPKATQSQGWISGPMVLIVGGHLLQDIDGAASEG